MLNFDFLGIFVMSSLYTVKDRKKYLSPFGSFLAGAIAGAGAKVAIYPLDLAKKRLQIQGNYNEVREGFGKVRLLMLHSYAK